MAYRSTPHCLTQEEWRLQANCGGGSFTAFGKSYLLCSCKIAVPDLFLLYGQVGVGMKGVGGVELGIIRDMWFCW